MESNPKLEDYEVFDDNDGLEPYDENLGGDAQTNGNKENTDKK